MSAKKIKNYLQKKRVLLVDNRVNTRATIKQALVGLGVDKSLIFPCETIESAVKRNEKEKFDIIISLARIGNEDCRELIKNHILTHPNRKEASLVVLSSQPNMDKSCLALDSDADLFLIDPLTMDNLSKALLRLFLDKTTGSPFKDHLFRAKEYFYKKEWENAKDVIEILKQDNQNLHEVLYLAGKIEEQLGQTEAAIEYFKDSLDIKSDYFRSLNALVVTYFAKDDFKTSYEYQRKMIKNYQLDPNDLPRLIKLSLANQNFRDIIKYAEMFPDLSDYSQDIKYSLSAALVISGKKLYEEGSKEEAEFCLKGAVKISDGKFSIIEGILKTYLVNGDVDTTQDLLIKYATQFAEVPEFQAIEARVAYMKGDTNGCLKLAIPLVERKFKSHDVFDIVIKSSIAIKRRPELIKKLKEDAADLFPQKANYFLNINERI